MVGIVLLWLLKEPSIIFPSASSTLPDPAEPVLAAGTSGTSPWALLLPPFITSHQGHCPCSHLDQLTCPGFPVSHQSHTSFASRLWQSWLNIPRGIFPAPLSHRSRILRLSAPEIPTQSPNIPWIPEFGSNSIPTSSPGGSVCERGQRDTNPEGTGQPQCPGLVG